MARPCGCAGECGCTILGGTGISATGAGTNRDPKIISLANPITGSGCNSIMDCVGGNLGAGLRYDNVTKDVAVKLSGDAGNNLVFGADNGLYTAAGGGGSGGGLTVASLATTDLIGGSYGAGDAQWPEGPMETYTAALSYGLPLIHVPVRRSVDFGLWCAHNFQLGTYNSRLSLEQSNTMDLKMLHHLWFTPGGDPNLTASTGDTSYTPQTGYFGFGWRDTRGAVSVTELFAEIQRRAVLYLQVRDIGALSSDCTDPFATYALLQGALRQYGVQQSVIVGSELPNNADRASIVSGLQKLKNEDNVAIAAHITTTAMATANPPATLVTEGFTWVMIDVNIADTAAATVIAYKTAGLSVMLTGAHRQFHFELQRTLALRGALCRDPMYVAGKLNSFTYRRTTGSWGWGTPDYGRYGYGDTSEYMRDKYRGYVLNGVPNEICIDGATKGPHETDPGFRPSSYFILMGEQCPIRDTRVAANQIGSPNNYDIDFGIKWDALISDTGRHAGIFFGCPDDRPKYDWISTTAHTKGYLFVLSQGGAFTIYRYDGIAYPGSGNPYQFTDTWASGWGTISPGTEYRIKVRVRPDRIIVGRADQAEGGTNTRTYTGANGTAWRGPYFYVLRHFFNDADSTRVRFRNLVLAEGTSS